MHRAKAEVAVETGNSSGFASMPVTTAATPDDATAGVLRHRYVDNSAEAVDHYLGDDRRKGCENRRQPNDGGGGCNDQRFAHVVS